MNNLNLTINHKHTIKDYINYILNINPTERFDSKSLSYAREEIITRTDETLRQKADLRLRYKFKIVNFKNESVSIAIQISSHCEEFKLTKMVEGYIEAVLTEKNLKLANFNQRVPLSSEVKIVDYLKEVKKAVDEFKQNILATVNSNEFQKYLDSIQNFYMTFDEAYNINEGLRHSYNDMILIFKRYPEETQEIKNMLSSKYIGFLKMMKKSLVELIAVTDEEAIKGRLGLDSKLDLLERFLENDTCIFDSEGKIKEINLD